MRAETCFFCSRPAYPSKGITFVRNDGKAYRFCRSKCHKNFKMKRNPRKLKWTKAFRKAAGKQMVVDSSLLLQARRNVPIRYNRELAEKTKEAMDRIAEIRARRERVFYKNRMAGNKKRALLSARKLVAEHGHLLQERPERPKHPKLRAQLAAKLAAQQATMEMEDVDAAELETTDNLKAKTTRALRQRLTVDGQVELVEEDAAVMVGEEEEDDDDMDMD